VLVWRKGEVCGQTDTRKGGLVCGELRGPLGLVGWFSCVDDGDPPTDPTPSPNPLLFRF